MKKIFSGVSFIVILMIIFAMLTACGGSLSGKYLAENGGGYRFSGKYSYAIGAMTGSEGMGCPYKIKDGHLTIYFGNLVSHDYEYRKSGSSIFLDGVEYKRQ